jgi:hypothetical protein
LKIGAQVPTDLAVEARTEIDALIKIISVRSPPAVSTIQRICALPEAKGKTTEAELLASLRAGCRRAAKDLRAHMYRNRNAPTVAGALRRLERKLIEIIKRREN